MKLRPTLGRALHTWCWLGLVVSATLAQTNSTLPASVPAGAESPVTIVPKAAVSARDARAADNAYIAGARHIERHEYETAEKDFGHALALNPSSPDYIRAFAFAREGRVSALVHTAAVARHDGRRAEADALLKQAHELDPDNRILQEHLDGGADAQSATFDPLRFPMANIASTLGGPVELTPDTAHHDVHIQADPTSAVREVFRLWGIEAQFDDSLPSGASVKIDMDNVDFGTASNLVLQMAKAFAVPVQPKVALIAHESDENRSRLQPLLEETMYLPGVPFEQMQDLAQMARDVLGVKNITASGTAATLIVRSDPGTIKLLNYMYADLLDGNSDVVMDMAIYEIDRSKTRNLGVQFPSSVSIFSVASELQNALNANASTLQTAINSGLISQGTLTDNQFKLVEVYYLFQAGLLSSAQSSELTSLLGLGYVGTIGGLPLAGVTLGSGATVNALLQSSDARLLDTIVLRASSSSAPTAAGASGSQAGGTAPATPQQTNNPNPAANASPQAAQTPAASAPPATAPASAATPQNPAASAASNYTARFRAGERYPIETSSYTTGGTSSALASALSGASTAVQQAAAAYLGSSSSVTIPQINFEDLGLTLEATPTVLRNHDVHISLHFKIEALGAGALNGIPVLNNREFTSQVIIPSGQTAVLTSEVTTNELRSIEGFPGLSELPGFQGTEHDAQLSSQELLITLTPHIVRNPKWRVESRAATLPSATRNTH